MNITYGSQLPSRIPHFVSPTRNKPSTRTRSIATIEEIDSEDDAIDAINEDDELDEIDDIEEITFPNVDSVDDPIEVDDKSCDPLIIKKEKKMKERRIQKKVIKS